MSTPRYEDAPYASGEACQPRLQVIHPDTLMVAEILLAEATITCGPENAASRRTLELVGAEFVETVGVPSDCIIFQSGHLRKCRYRLDLNEFAL